MLKLGMGNVKAQVGVVGVDIFADRMLMKVFYNLLEDSLEHGGDVTRVRLSSGAKGEDLAMIYEDDGIGIPAEEKDRIFELGIVSKGGSGLFLAKEILAITGITIRENGEPGKGARFEMLVPKAGFRVH
jgi:signal transduction histidine kinase